MQAYRDVLLQRYLAWTEMLPHLPPGSVPAAGTPHELWPCRAVALLKSLLKLVELQTSDDGFAEILEWLL